MIRSLNKERNFIRNYSTGLAAILVFLGTISTPTQASSDKQADSSNEVPVHMVVTVKPRTSGATGSGGGGQPT